MATAPAQRYSHSWRTPTSFRSTVSIRWCSVTCAYRPLSRASKGVISPLKATRGLRPNVLKSRLNQTTSGFSRLSALIRRNALRGSSNDQQRSTEKPSGSTCADGNSSARTVRLRKGLRFNSCAM